MTPIVVFDNAFRLAAVFGLFSNVHPQRCDPALGLKKVLTMNVMELRAKGSMSSQQVTEVDLNLTPEQIRALSGHAKAMSEGKIVLRMLSDDEVYGKVKVAAYTYSGSTCCC